MYTIFINESVIYLASAPIEVKQAQAVKYDEIRLDNLIQELEIGLLKAICVYHDDLDQLWTNFKTHFTILEAAGGLVFNEKNETLWIYRHNKWDLPKGKIEDGENTKEAAIREVEEECGVTNLKILCPIDKTYHVYKLGKKRILKISHWYKMFTNSDQDLKPQLEEHITKVVWLSETEIPKVLKNTYDNIKLLCSFAVPTSRKK